MTNKKYIKSIEITNFKNFAQKTNFEFAQGLNVIVGENGSGKSNLLECIDFVLDNRILRTQPNLHLFNSSNSSNVITVTLTTSTNDCITRKLNKISKNKTYSKYFINNTPVSKSEITKFMKKINFKVMDNCGCYLNYEQINIYSKELKAISQNKQIIAVSHRNEIIEKADKVINITKKVE